MPSETPGAGRAEPSIDWDVLARHMAGETSPADEAATAEWLRAHPDDARMIARLDDVLNGLTLNPDSVTGVDVEAALAKVNGLRAAEGLRIVQGSGQRMGRAMMHRAPASNWMPYAAAAALIVAVGVLSWKNRAARTEASASLIAERTISTPIGARDSLVLPDGSTVLLGPGSQLTIGAGYGQATRTVAVRGEAYFDVKHDASHPFVVTANGTTIRDVGTAFVVHSDSTGEVRVAVTSGVVELAPPNASAAAIRLDAGDVGTVSTHGVVASERGAGTPDDLAWTRGRLVFRDTPLAEVRDDLWRWYGIHLDVRDPALLARPLSASFDGDSITRVLDVMSLALGATIERHGDTAVVRPLPGTKRRE